MRWTLLTALVVLLCGSARTLPADDLNFDTSAIVADSDLGDLSEEDLLARRWRARNAMRMANPYSYSYSYTPRRAAQYRYRFVRSAAPRQYSTTQTVATAGCPCGENCQCPDGCACRGSTPNPAPNPDPNPGPGPDPLPDYDAVPPPQPKAN